MIVVACFLIVATKEVPEDQVLCFSGSVIHPWMEGRFPLYCMSIPLANKGHIHITAEYDCQSCI